MINLYFYVTLYYLCVISVVRREINKNFALLGYYAASSGDCLPTYRHYLDVPMRFNHGTKIHKLFSNSSRNDN